MQKLPAIIRSALTFALLCEATSLAFGQTTPTCPPGTILHTTTFSNTFPPTPPPWMGLTLTLPQFNPGPGQILLQADITVEGTVSGSIQGENLSTTGHCLWFSSLGSSVQVAGPAIQAACGVNPVVLPPFGSPFGPDDLAAFVPPIDYQPPSGITHIVPPTMEHQSCTSTNPADLLNVFTGSGNLVFTHDASDNSTHSGCGNLAAIFVNQTSLKITVVYSWCQNTPPMANDDSAQVCLLGSVDIPVLANDSDSNGGSLNCGSLVVTIPPVHGTATVVSNCTSGAPCPGMCVHYVSTDPNYTGLDVFTYQIQDNIGRIGTAHVSVTICGVVTGADTATVCQGGTVNIPVLQNDSTGCGAINCASLVIAQPPQHGVATVVNNCTSGAPCPGVCVNYTPNPGYAGPDSFLYRVRNNQSPPCSGSGSVSINVCSVVAINDAATVCTGGVVNIPVLNNDVTSCGSLDCGSLVIGTPPAHGTVSLVGCTGTGACNGCSVKYTSTAGYTGPDSFTYRVSNNASPACISNPATVDITVCGVTANNDTANVCAGSAVNIPVLGNDVAGCGTIDCTTLAIVNPPAHGIATILGCSGNCTGCVVQYTANPGYTGPDSFTYHVANNQTPPCISNNATVSITVCSVTANNDSANVCSGSFVNIPVLANDTTTCGALDCTSLTLGTLPLHGTAQIVGCTGSGACAGCVVKYTPNAGYTGPDSFTYRVSNNQTPACISSPATVSLTVCGVTAVNDTANVCAGSVVSIPVLANDVPGCGAIDCTTLAIGTPPAHGTATVVGCSGNCAGCVIQYTPTAGYTGPDSFTYHVANNQVPPCVSNNGTVNITVCAVVANPDTATVCAGSFANIPVLANDVAGCGALDCGSLSIVNQPAHGTVVTSGCTGSGACASCVVKYTPNAGYTGPDSFSYRVSNNLSPACASNAATVSITVCGVTANNDTATVCAGNVVSIPVLANDAAGCGAIDCTTLTIGTPPAHGTATVVGCTGNCTGCVVQYTANPGYTGPDSFTYHVSNNQTPACVSNNATVGITVCSVTANNDSANVCTGSFVNIPVLANDTTSCGALDCGSIAIGTQPLHGTAQIVGCTGSGTCASCVVKYTPNAGYTGPDSFTYRVSNNQTPACISNAATVSVTVCGVTAVNDSANVCAGSVVSIPVLANDTAGCGAIDCTTLAIGTPPAHGTATVVGCTGNCAGCVIQYTPTAGYTGPDSFTYHVANNQVPPCVSNNGTVNLTVCAVVANPDTATVCAGSFANIPVLANDVAGCGALDCGSLTIVTQPAHGTVVTSGCTGTGACASCVVKYTPNAGYTGPDSFSYRVSNNLTPACASNAATVSITVCSTTANNDTANVCVGSFVNIPVLANDTTSCGVLDCGSLAIATRPSHGTAQIVGCTGSGACAGCVVKYTPTPGYSGPDSFTYHVSNNGTPACVSNNGTVSITVCGVTANNDSANVCVGATASIAVLANDTPTCGAIDCSTLMIVTPPAHGTATVAGCVGGANCATSCKINYTPNAGYSGPDSFTYKVSNDSVPPCPSNIATVNLTVCSTTAQNDIADVCSGATVNIHVLVNDSTSCGVLNCASLVIVTAPSHGTAVPTGCTGTGTCANCVIGYTSDSTYSGPDTFTYRVANDSGCVSNPATVTVQVKASPIALDDKVIKDPNSSAVIPNIDVLSNDDPGANCGPFVLSSVTLVAPFATKGTPSVNPDGTINYLPNTTFLGEDVFGYRVTNSCGCTGTALVRVNQPSPCTEINRRECGSLLLYPEYDNTPGRVTMLTVTMGCCEPPTGSTLVEFRFIRSATCTESNQTFPLSPCDTVTMLTSSVNSGGVGAKGYVYAYAKNNIPSPNNPTGTPIVFNHLIGQLLILDGIDALNYGMNAVSFRGYGANGTDVADNTPNDDDGDGIRDLNGAEDMHPEYDAVPDRILIPRFLGQIPGVTDSHLILVNLSGGSAFTTTISIEAFDDSENAFSATYSFYCWAKPSLLDINGAFSNDSLLNSSTSPNEILGEPGQKAGWFWVDGLVANSTQEAIADPAVYAVLVECEGPNRCVANLPWELCSQKNGDLLPVNPLGDGPNPVNGDNQ